jgi:glycosyltransferase involved in cell wall biosynthesis
MNGNSKMLTNSEREATPLASVIVPVYNRDSFLPRCLQSITHQTYRNLEIILIDDGSTDKSGQICNAYAARDSRIVVIHQKNQGVSAARNAGLKILHGKVLFFVDSDDYIAQEIIEKCIRKLQEDNTDIVIFSRQETHRGKEGKAFIQNEVSSDEIMKQILYSEYFPLWNKTYKRELWDGIYFPEGMVSSEDCYILPELLNKNPKFSTISDIGYFNEVSPHESLSRKFYMSSKYFFLDFITWRNRLNLKNIPSMYAGFCEYMQHIRAIQGLCKNFFDHLLISNEKETLLKYLHPKGSIDYYTYSLLFAYYSYEANKILKTVHGFYPMQEKNTLKGAIRIYLSDSKLNVLDDSQLGNLKDDIFQMQRIPVKLTYKIWRWGILQDNKTVSKIGSFFLLNKLPDIKNLWFSIEGYSIESGSGSKDDNKRRR